MKKNITFDTNQSDNLLVIHDNQNSWFVSFTNFFESQSSHIFIKCNVNSVERAITDGVGEGIRFNFFNFLDSLDYFYIVYPFINFKVSIIRISYCCIMASMVAYLLLFFSIMLFFLFSKIHFWLSQQKLHLYNCLLYYTWGEYKVTSFFDFILKIENEFVQIDERFKATVDYLCNIIWEFFSLDRFRSGIQKLTYLGDNNGFINSNYSNFLFKFSRTGNKIKMESAIDLRESFSSSYNETLCGSNDLKSYYSFILENSAIKDLKKMPESELELISADFSRLELLNLGLEKFNFLHRFSATYYYETFCNGFYITNSFYAHTIFLIVCVFIFYSIFESYVLAYFFLSAYILKALVELVLLFLFVFFLDWFLIKIKVLYYTILSVLNFFVEWFLSDEGRRYYIYCRYLDLQFFIREWIGFFLYIYDKINKMCYYLALIALSIISIFLRSPELNKEVLKYWQEIINSWTKYFWLNTWRLRRVRLYYWWLAFTGVGCQSIFLGLMGNAESGMSGCVTEVYNIVLLNWDFIKYLIPHLILVIICFRISKMWKRSKLGFYALLWITFTVFWYSYLMFHFDIWLFWRLYMPIHLFVPIYHLMSTVSHWSPWKRKFLSTLFAITWLIFYIYLVFFFYAY